MPFLMPFMGYTQDTKQTIDKPSIGVLKFKPLGEEAVQSNLGIILASTLESSLKNRYEMNLVERAQLGSLFEEAAFQDDMFVNGVAPADFILVANFKGSEAHLIVILKLIDTKTTMAVIQEKLEGNLEQVLDQLYLHAQKVSEHFMPGVQNEVGFLSIQSKPSGAEVLLNGRSIGLTPISEYSISLNSSELIIRKKGYIEQVFEAQFDGKKELRHQVSLIKKKKATHKVFGVGSKYMKPQVYNLSPGNDFYVFAGMQWESWMIQVKGGGSQFIFGGYGLDYIDKWSVPSDIHPDESETRKFNYKYISLNFDYVFNPNNPYYTPYVGGGVGMAWLEDKSVDKRFYGAQEVVMSLKTPLIHFGGGVQILPASPISFRIYGNYEAFKEEFTLKQVKEITVDGMVDPGDQSTQWKSYNLGIEVVF